MTRCALATFLSATDVPASPTSPHPESRNQPAARRARAAAAGVASILVLSLALAGTARAAIERCPGALHNDPCAEETGFCPATAPVGPIVSDWPTYQHDVQHTGKSPKTGPTCAAPSPLWATKLKGRIQGAAVIGPAGPSGHGIVYVPSGQNPVCALDPTDGHVLWCKTTEAVGRDVGFGGIALGNGERLYIGTRDNDLWAYQLPVPPQEPATVLYRQKVCTDGDVATPPVIGADGLVYMGSDSLSSGTGGIL